MGRRNVKKEENPQLVYPSVADLVAWNSEEEGQIFMRVRQGPLFPKRLTS